jgi:hypothetical protein
MRNLTRGDKKQTQVNGTKIFKVYQTAEDNSEDEFKTKFPHINPKSFHTLIGSNKI